MRQKEKYELNKSTILYCMALSIYIIYIIFSYSKININFNEVKNYIYSIIIILLFLSNWDKKMNKNEILMFIFSLLLLIAIMFISKNTNFYLIFNLLFVFSARRENIKLILKVSVITINSVLLFLILMSKLGIIENVIIFNNELIQRQSLGMIHPNTFYNFFAIGIIINIYLDEKTSFISYLIYISLSVFFYVITRSRAGFIIILLYIAINILFRKDSKVIDIIIKVAKYLMIILMIISIITMLEYETKSNAILKLNDITSRRIEFAYNFYKKYGISIFGQEITYKEVVSGSIENKNDILDNTYIYMIVDLGIIISVYYIYIYNKLIKILIKNNKKAEIIILAIFLIYGLIERSILNLVPNISLLFFSEIFNDTQKKLEDVKIYNI